MRSKRHTKWVATRLRDAQALELKKAGASYDQIAQHLGYAQRSGAHHAVHRALREALEDRNADAEEVRELELQRIDDMMLGLWKKAKAGDVQAIGAALRLMERTAAYLGLDAPKRQEISGNDGGAIQIEQTLDVNVTIEERQRRILAIVEQARARANPALEPARPDLASSAGSTAGRLADAG